MMRIGFQPQKQNASFGASPQKVEKVFRELPLAKAIDWVHRTTAKEARFKQQDEFWRTVHATSAVGRKKARDDEGLEILDNAVSISMFGSKYRN